MLQLGDLRVRDDEIQRIAGHRGRLVVVLAWRLDELPLILDLAGVPVTFLSWHVADDPFGGIQVELLAWHYAPAGRDGGDLSLLLRLERTGSSG